MLWEIGVGCLGFFIYVGLGLFVDLCNGGGKLNECIIDDLVELIEIDGEIKFCYCFFKVDYVILCGIYVDFWGNVSFEEEVIDMDSYFMVLVVYNSGGKVFV